MPRHRPRVVSASTRSTACWPTQLTGQTRRSTAVTRPSTFASSPGIGAGLPGKFPGQFQASAPSPNGGLQRHVLAPANAKGILAAHGTDLEFLRANWHIQNDSWRK